MRNSDFYELPWRMGAGSGKTGEWEDGRMGKGKKTRRMGEGQKDLVSEALPIPSVQSTLHAKVPYFGVCSSEP